nr:reverse transcriptase domain-containing protein [Tanacetum cinerariifolium]GEX46202.1 reverse transcriptase domain-containing protein [Tanacetum cinerariifolium]
MAIFVISLSSDSSRESVRTSTTQCILFGMILTTIPSTVPIVDSPTIPPIAPTIKQLILVGRPYRTYPNGITSSDHFTSNDSSRETSLDYHSDTSSNSSSRHSSSGHSISDSPCDSPTSISARPSRKRCWSPTTSVPVASPVLRALSLLRADLLSPRKRIKDSDFMTDFEVSSKEGFVPHVPIEIGLGFDVEDIYEPYTEPDIDPDVQANTDANITFADDTAELVRENYPDLVSVDGFLEVIQRGLDVVMQELYDHMVEIPAHRVRVIEKALEAYDATRNPRTKTEIEDEQQDDNVEANGNNGNGNGNGIGNLNVNNRGVKMETVFHISNFSPKYQVKYASCTMMNGALTWWNSHKMIVGVNAAYVMTWKALMKLMTKVYRPRNKIQKMEIGLWNLTVKVCIANKLMDQKLKGYVVKNAENKRRFENKLRDNRGQQQPFKRHNVNGQNVARAYTVGNNVKRKAYAGNFPYCNKCIMHHVVYDENRKNNTRNKTGNNKVKAKAYAIGEGGASPDSNVITGHPFNIDLMPIELGSFDVIIGMDWLAKYHAMIICDEKIIRIPYGDEVLVIEGDGCNGENKSKLSII